MTRRAPQLDQCENWTFEAVAQRYHDYCRRYRVKWSPVEVQAYYRERRWLTGILRPLILRAKQGDLAAAEVCIELMEEDRGLAFGCILKSNIPRAISKCALTPYQQDRIRQRVLDMLTRGYLPKEFRQYAWLVRKLGLLTSPEWQARLDQVDDSNPWAAWYIQYLTKPHPPRQP
ncbi:MAG: hypothetical protein AB7S38_00025 [Vulcanimicrobiota bacterium]